MATIEIVCETRGAVQRCGRGSLCADNRICETCHFLANPKLIRGWLAKLAAKHDCLAVRVESFQAKLAEVETVLQGHLGSGAESPDPRWSPTLDNARLMMTELTRLVAKVVKLTNERDRLAARVAELEEALRPFAELWDYYGGAEIWGRSPEDSSFAMQVAVRTRDAWKAVQALDAIGKTT